MNTIVVLPKLITTGKAHFIEICID